MSDSSTLPPPTTPAAAAPVDISTIEAAKENIVPLHSGRSASQLASVFSSSSTRSGLGVKLDAEHAKFRAQINAVQTYEETGKWKEEEEAETGLKVNEVAQLAEDPLDISHQYVRFIIANYPAGANAANKLVPVLEETTRRFLGDERYTNDPRYFRLWAHYAKNMESPEECYRFLFAKGIAEKLAALYEEYAKVLEAAGRRKQADQVYLLGINRRATPLDRLKRSHFDFQARMLIAPPLPSPPRPSDTDSGRATVRPILSSNSARPAVGGVGTGVGPKGNGSMFAVFKDDAAGGGGGGGAAGQEAQWDDFGTVKSRKRENDLEKKEWSGETMPQAAPALGGGFKLEVYRDETATSNPASHSLHETDVFSRSNRAPSEAEQLRVNPFKNYSAADVDLLTRDPLENLQVLAPPPVAVKKTKKATTSSTGEKKKVKSTSASSSSSKSAGAAESSQEPLQPRPQQIAFKLEILKDGENGWISFEEERVKRKRDKYIVEAESWNGWEWKGAWDEEMARTQRTSYKIDAETGWPILYDPEGAPLYDFLRPPTPVVVEQALPESSSPRPQPVEDGPSSSPRSPSSRPLLDLGSPNKPAASSPARLDQSPSPSLESRGDPSSPSYPPLDPNRPPSPTMNTKLAKSWADDLFAKTLDMTQFNPESRNAHRSGEDEEEPSTDNDSDDEDNDFQGGLEYGASQYSTQQGTQASEISSDAGGFQPFSQTRSMMGDDSSFFGSQDAAFVNATGGGGNVGASTSSASTYGPGLYALAENDENDENNTPPAAPMQLFRDAAPPAVPTANGGGGFRPVTRTARAPLGAKPIAASPLAPQQPAFSVFSDSRLPSSQSSENEHQVYEDQPEDYEAPLRGGESPERPEYSDGYAMGRRERGVPSRYAPFVDNMTPITERTLEITAAMNTNVHLSASQRSRRSSAFGNPAPVQEDDEPSTEEDDDDEEDAGDRAFVVVDQSSGRGLERDDSSSSSDGSDSDSSSDSEDDDDFEQPPLPSHQHVPSMDPVPSLSIHRDQHPPASTFDESTISRLSLGHEQQQAPSFENSLNTSLPEGLTIGGNQSGMTTGLVIEDATSTNQISNLVPLDPYDRDMLRTFLSQASNPIQNHENVSDLSSHTADKLAELQKMAKKRANSKTKDRTGIVDDAWDLELDGQVFSVREKLGEGSFGAVFRVALPADDDDREEEDAEASFDVDGTETFFAVKVERPSNYWEFYVADQMQSRLPESAVQSVLKPHCLFAYSDESYLLLTLCDRGSLLNAVNKAQEFRIAPPGAAVTGLDELLAIFFVIELLRTLEGFHSSGFIHGDLKIDNCLLRFDDVAGPWQSIYDPTGANGWGQKGLTIIDYGRTIDTTMFPPGQSFTCDLKTDQYDCIEMQTKRPWTFEPDYHGVASIAYCALFGHYMETESIQVEVDGGVKSKRVPKQQFRRYHQIALWTKLFDMLLNPRDVRSDASLPITNELSSLRVEMQEWLAANCNKNGKSLKTFLSKLERSSLTK